MRRGEQVARALRAREHQQRLLSPPPSLETALAFERVAEACVRAALDAETKPLLSYLFRLQVLLGDRLRSGLEVTAEQRVQIHEWADRLAASVAPRGNDALNLYRKELKALVRTLERVPLSRHGSTLMDLVIRRTSRKEDTAGGQAGPIRHEESDRKGKPTHTGQQTASPSAASPSGATEPRKVRQESNGVPGARPTTGSPTIQSPTPELSPVQQDVVANPAPTTDQASHQPDARMWDEFERAAAPGPLTSTAPPPGTGDAPVTGTPESEVRLEPARPKQPSNWSSGAVKPATPRQAPDAVLPEPALTDEDRVMQAWRTAWERAGNGSPGDGSGQFWEHFEKALDSGDRLERVRGCVRAVKVQSGQRYLVFNGRAEVGLDGTFRTHFEVNGPDDMTPSDVRLVAPGFADGDISLAALAGREPQTKGTTERRQ